ncbi:hypothetical protein GCM10010218_20670 [Streptomyces mashuensis]|uniref:DUF2470 domain-containing protein n=1 Tax=Streptomyces mashuensis TaxID=33904 RepID=A0A919B0V5_9ACTN|nr:DUF2470 domain-containing protein [Streptomyces mashuensis]GHF39257.1 hypothetical protein GCM10010218_20670 [Streptomyces mashuensis]
MPSAAERTRTLVQGTCSGALLIPGHSPATPDSLAERLTPQARTVGRDGEVYLVLPADAAAVRAATHAQDDELSAVLELVDVAPVALPGGRIRGRALLGGWLTSVPGVAEPGRMLLRLEVGEVRIEDLWGADGVDVEDFARAEPDPLGAHEGELLQHLCAGHGDQVRRLSSLLGAERGPYESVVPVALDRFGLRVRFAVGGGDCFDARFEFPRPVRDVHGLRREMHRLFEAAME